MIFKKAFSNKQDHLQLSLITVGRATVDSTWRGTVQSPDCSRLYYIVRGVAYIHAAGRSHALEAGHWYLLPPGHSFTYECPHAMEHVYFHIRLCGENGFELLESDRDVLTVAVPEALSDAFLLPQGSGLEAQLQLYGRLLQLLQLFCDGQALRLTPRSFSPCIERAMRFINANLSFSLSAEQIAEGVFVSRSTLEQHFRRELSASVKQYVADRVLAEAARLLKDPSLSIGEISDLLGFADPLYFSKKFRQSYGVSPRTYRNQPFA
ncbi:MAG: helix-turn-helix transcriptional regulator [Clostridia bacterium]|nr:helix-turn-helix transcriptional regulator [Clostridia bacterium]